MDGLALLANGGEGARFFSPYRDVREMLKAMLADRFQLKAAFVTTPLPAILLSFDHATPEAVRSAQAAVDCQPFLSELRPPISVPLTSEGWPMCGPPMMQGTPHGRILHYRSAPLHRIEHDLENMLRQVVLVSPAKPGLFDVDFQCPPDYVLNTPTPDVDSFLSALHDQLGVEAVIKTTPVEVLQIESAAQPRLGAQ